MLQHLPCLLWIFRIHLYPMLKRLYPKRPPLLSAHLPNTTIHSRNPLLTSNRTTKTGSDHKNGTQILQKKRQILITTFQIDIGKKKKKTFFPASKWDGEHHRHDKIAVKQEIIISLTKIEKGVGDFKPAGENCFLPQIERKRDASDREIQNHEKIISTFFFFIPWRRVLDRGIGRKQPFPLEIEKEKTALGHQPSFGNRKKKKRKGRESNPRLEVGLQVK